MRPSEFNSLECDAFQAIVQVTAGTRDECRSVPADLDRSG